MENRTLEATRLRRSVMLLAAALAFFVASMGINLARGGGFRAIDLVVPLVALLLAAYYRRWQRARRGGH